MLTYQDCVEHLITSSFGGPQDAEQRDIRTAVQRAYQELAWMRDWQYYHTHGRIIFQDDWIGTVTYNSGTRTLTKVTGDAFPLDATRFHVRIGDIVCKILTRVSDTALVLDATLKLSDDIDEAVAARLYRSVYPLPADFRNIDPPIDESSWTGFQYVTQDHAMKMERADDIAGPPAYWTVRKDPDSMGYAIQVLGYPIKVEALDFTYRRSPRLMRLSGHETAARAGTITVSGTSVTGSGTSFSSDMVGSVLRIGTAANHPDSYGSMNPYAAEARITAIANTSTATIDASLSYSGVKYVVTDPVDMPTGMHNAMLSACEYWLARIRDKSPDKAFSMYQRDLRLAMENDDVAPVMDADRVVWDAYGWRSPLLPDDIDGGAP
jgi:hypothetical protein